MLKFLLPLALAALPANAKTFTGTAKFEGDTLGGFVKITSTGCKVRGDDTTFTFTADLATCKDEKYDLRDKHTKEKYLEVGKYPTAVLKLTPPASTAGAFDFKGDLTLKGQTAPVSGKATVDGAKVTATFQVNLDKYPAVGAPSWQGVAMDKVVTVTIEGEVK